MRSKYLAPTRHVPCGKQRRGHRGQEYEQRSWSAIALRRIEAHHAAVAAIPIGIVRTISNDATKVTAAAQ